MHKNARSTVPPVPPLSLRWFRSKSLILKAWYHQYHQNHSHVYREKGEGVEPWETFQKGWYRWYRWYHCKKLQTHALLSANCGRT
jgi:hypothetical protein